MAHSSSLISDFGQEMVQAYAVNDRMNQLILEHLDSRAWRAHPPGRGGRTIAAIFAHVHNIRCKWLRLSAPHLKLPARLDRNRSTQKQARAALAESASRCCEMLAEALADSTPRRTKSALGAIPDGCSRQRVHSGSPSAGLQKRAKLRSPCGVESRVPSFLRDGWAKPWRPGAAMFAYMISHDAHHRGQICMLAHQLGFPLAFAAGPGIWGWEKLWKERGFKLPSAKEKISKTKT